MNTRTHFRALEFTRSRTEPSHRARRIRRTMLIALGSLASIALLGCSRGHASTSATAPRVVKVIEVDTTRRETVATTHYTGVVRARTESNLGFRVAGKISERLVNAGDAVKKDQPLLKLDPTDYELALKAARAVQKQASLELERVRVLVEKHAESHDALERAAAAAESSTAQANQIANQASYTTLVAESDGVVITTLAEPGQVVTAGQPVVVLAEDGQREAAIDIPEGSLDNIRQHPATACLYLNQAVTVPATLREIAGAADPVARTYQARYILEGDQTQFPLGATVTVRITRTGGSGPATTEIPLASLIDRGDGAAVWVVDPKTSALQKRAISIAKLGAETALVSRGLAPGDVVVALGAQLLNAGEVVRVMNAPAKETK